MKYCILIDSMNDNELEVLVRSCIRKYRYPTAQTAQEAINRVHKKRDTPLRYYFCKRCCGYHLTKRVGENIVDGRKKVCKPI